ncbi:MAG: hypothetical protein WA728_16520 [Xanthobacteraceae bacterium]
MTNAIGRRLSRIETEVQKKIGEPNRWRPGDPVFKLIDDPRDPENARRLEQAEKFHRENPNGLIIRHIIVYPPNRD